MAKTNKIRTNFIEILLRQALIGKDVYLDDGTKITIDDINYQPLLQEIYIHSGSGGYKLSMNSNYDFDLDLDVKNKIKPNKGRIKGGDKII
jgi:hypothetical protein